VEGVVERHEETDVSGVLVVRIAIEKIRNDPQHRFEETRLIARLAAKEPKPLSF
jgi:hypothetical protein